MRVLSLFLALTLTSFAKPTLWIIGDSTVRNRTENQLGWGDPLKSEFDADKIEVVNRAIGGRSSRSFLTEGRWDDVLAEMEAGDYVLIQFGHNDGGEYFKGDRPRASIKGVGEETRTGVVEATGEEETVRSFGWYLRKYCTDAKAKGATPVVVSLIPRNRRDDEGHIHTQDDTYAKWAEQAAEQTGARFIDFNAILAERYDALGESKTDALFDPDEVHTNARGAAYNAGVLAEAIRELPDCDLADSLKP